MVIKFSMIEIITREESMNASCWKHVGNIRMKNLFIVIWEDPTTRNI
jgi:hypothetical protein